MTRLILEKTRNKKIMTFCLILGVILLVAAVSCQPMYKAGSLNRVLRNQFSNSISETGKNPTVISRDEIYDMRSGVTYDAIVSEYDRVREVISGYLSFIGIKGWQRVASFDSDYRAQRGYLDGKDVQYVKEEYSDSVLCNVSCIPGLDEHISLIQYYEDGIPEGCIPCVVSRRTIETQKLYVGQVVRYPDFVDANGKKLTLIITGVFEEDDENGTFFYEKSDELLTNLFVTEAEFADIASNYDIKNIRIRDHYMFDYDRINPGNIDDVKYYVGQIAQNVTITETITEHIDSYELSRKSISVTLWVMELPLLAMVVTFIYMVSKQVVGSELSEIAAYKSRGVSRFQIILLYLYQSALISLVGLFLGIPCGLVMSKVAGGAVDFLTFSSDNLGIYQLTGESVLYGIGAALIAIVCVIIPVIGMSSVSIVQAKSDYSIGKKSIWEKCFIDVILLGVSLYLLYNFMQNKENIRQNALVGQMMDPFTFIDTCLFLAAAGLVFIRLSKLIVTLIFNFGRPKWKSNIYIAFMQTIRNYRKQTLIAIFLILTIAFGIFYSNTARTINSNNIERVKYNTGCDAQITEKWRVLTYREKDGTSNYRYDEPEYGRFLGLVENGICESITRVITNESTVISFGKKSVDKCTVYGINTKEFGETATLKDGLNGGEHWFNYLNKLAQASDGVIISRNLAEELGVNEGETLSLNRLGEFPQFKELSKGTLAVRVVAVVDAWPGYERYYYTNTPNEDGEPVKTENERYMAVINYSASVYAYKISPYNVWIKLAEGRGYEEAESYLESAGVGISNSNRLDKNIAKVKETLDIQIINGMFTLGFIVALIVCVSGFLIYWVTSIRQREMQFGVYRAMGMSARKLGSMLVAEQLLSTLFSIICGLLGGIAATLLFESLFCIVYLPERHNLELYMYYDIQDFIRLGIVIVVMIAVCMFVLERQVKKLNITDVLKLGEE